MGIYASEVPDFTQAVEAVLIKHGLIADPATGADRPADTDTGEVGEHAAGDEQPAGQQ